MNARAHPSVLLVEDTVTLAGVYKAALEKNGYAVECAYLASEARAAHRGASGRIVLLDLMLPDGDGLDLLKEMRAADPEGKIIVITSNGSVKSAVSAMRDGAFDFLMKPFDDRRLLAAVKNAKSAIERPKPTAEDPAADPVGAAHFAGQAAQLRLESFQVLARHRPDLADHGLATPFNLLQVPEGLHLLGENLLETGGILAPEGLVPGARAFQQAAPPVDLFLHDVPEPVHRRCEGLRHHPTLRNGTRSADAGPSFGISVELSASLSRSCTSFIKASASPNGLLSAIPRASSVSSMSRNISDDIEFPNSPLSGTVFRIALSSCCTKTASSSLAAFSTWRASLCERKPAPKISWTLTGSPSWPAAPRPP